MSAEFVHLHVHSQYSLLDGALKVKDLAKKAQALGMRSVALTDHGNMFGAIQHWLACKELGVGAILGCEINVAREGGQRSTPRAAGASADLGEDVAVDHLVLLAADAEGYKNLVRVVSAGHLEPASSRAPSVKLDVLARNQKGIIALSGCMGGVVAQEILEKGEDAGRARLALLRDAVEPGSLYVELQDHGLVEQPVLNDILARAAEDMGLPVVATNDAHFAGRDDGEGQLYLQCIANNRSFAGALEHHHGSWEMFLKPAEEMAQLFRDRPQAVRTTLEIAERCSALKLKLGEPMLPRFKVPEGFDEPGYFRHIAREGLQARFEEIGRTGRAIDHDAYKARLEIELDVICGMKFPGYFLIVWDFIRYAKEHGIPVGPGRGSGAGSLVAYAMRITDLDPLPYNLLFERFLNPERVSMPDFDVDFCMDRRDEVIRYVGETYGARSVGQIATFHELKSRSVLKDVARTMGLPANEAQRIASLVPQKGPGVMYTIPEALEVEPKLKALVETDPTIKELVHQAMKLEGLTRHAGMHAAGVVISEGPLDDHVPCFKNGDQIVTQYHKDDVEKAGLVKFDFLGLKTLTVVDIAVRLVDARPDRQGKPRLDIAALPLDDRETYELLQSGETTGVFQLESSGMQQLFKDLKPTRFEDIVAAVALYRPGPLGTGMVKDFVDCKHGRKPIARMHALVDELLEPTYGVIVYQEQVMQITQKLAGYSLGGADLLRRAMGKKKAEEMAKQKSTFVDGSLKNGVSQEDADRIFGLLEYFAGYGFNKCVIGATTIVDADTGERSTVGDLFRTRRPMRVHAMGEDGKLRPRRVTDVMSNGRKPVFEVVTQQGKRIVATGNHPFRTYEGWVRLDELSPGRLLAAPTADFGDVVWDPIASIRPAGEEETYDLTVEVDHNFVAEGLIVHNSHSAAYALVTYQTAYLKAHYPVEFLCALMTADKDKIEKVVRIIAEGRAWGVETLPPSLNESMIDFTVVYGDPAAPRQKGKKSQRGKRRARDPYDPKIRFGLGAVRGVGEAALEAILEVRKEGTFGDLFDMAERVDAKRVNKGVLEALVASGALDELHGPRAVSRAMAFAAIDKALERSRNASRDRERGQTSLFGLFDQVAKASEASGGPVRAASSEYPQVEPWDLRETLVREKEALGFYVSGHPLDRYGVELGRFDVQPTNMLAAMDPWAKVRVAGVVEGYRVRIFKGGGGKVAFFTLEDPQGRIEVKCREKFIDLYEAVLANGEPVLVSGKLQFPQVEEGEEDASGGPREPTLLLDEVHPLADAIRAATRSVHVKLPAGRTRRDQIERLRSVLDESPGSCPVQLTILLDDGAEALFALPSTRVEPSDLMLARLEKLFGERVVELR